MTQKERRLFLIEYLLEESGRFRGFLVPEETGARERLLRSLMNIRPAKPVSETFIEVQDAYLTHERKAKGVVGLAGLTAVRKDLYLWQGDITRLSADAIVNAANSAMLGCFVPGHDCIDNAIHSAAGVQLRLECARLMAKQNTPEPTGSAKITNGYNLPCRYVLHTVGPIVEGSPTEEQAGQLAGCYRACLTLAAERALASVAFCCISTGEYRFPPEAAARIAIRAVTDFRASCGNSPAVIFNVFKDSDYAIYKRLLGCD